MAKRKFVKINNYTIFFDEIYYLCYTGGHRELPKKAQDNWDRTKTLPGLAQKREQFKLGLDNNPNVVPIKGINLVSLIQELQFTPFFDRAFNTTKMLKLTDVIVYEAIKQRNYEIAMKK